jgi:hypothetical protein
MSICRLKLKLRSPLRVRLQLGIKFFAAVPLTSNYDLTVGYAAQLKVWLLPSIRIRDIIS